MAKESLRKTEKKIQELKCRLAALGDMRPGTLSVQYRDPTERKKPFHQISYTHKGKGRSEYVRAQNLETVRDEIATYKMFKTIADDIIELSIKASRIRCANRKS